MPAVTRPGGEIPAGAAPHPKGGGQRSDEQREQKSGQMQKPPSPPQ